MPGFLLPPGGFTAMAQQTPTVQQAYRQAVGGRRAPAKRKRRTKSRSHTKRGPGRMPYKRTRKKGGSQPAALKRYWAKKRRAKKARRR